MSAVDGDDNGDPNPNGSTSSPVFEVAALDAPTGETDVSENPAHSDNTDDANSNLTIDFGFEPRPGISLGNRIWNDVDGDGAQQDSEPGIDGVRVELLDDTGTLLTYDLTDDGGYYLFPGLVPGDYVVNVPAENFDEPTDTLWGHFPTSGANVGNTDPNDDVDLVNDGQIQDAPFGDVATQPVTLDDLFEPQGEADLSLIHI